LTFVPSQKRLISPRALFDLSLARNLKTANAASVAPKPLRYRNFRDASQGLAGTESDVILLHYWLSFAGVVMTHHPHRAGAHPSPALSPSLLRLSALQRLSIAGFLIALIWAAAFWATN
jgi:hypothetical protein